MIEQNNNISIYKAQNVSWAESEAPLTTVNFLVIYYDTIIIYIVIPDVG